MNTKIPKQVALFCIIVIVSYHLIINKISILYNTEIESEQFSI